MQLLRLVPMSLTLLRLALAPAIVAIASTGQWRWAMVACLLAGFLSDIFDGILARRFGLATAFLRRLDSVIDLIFYAAVCWAAWAVHPEVIRKHGTGIGILLLLEVTCNAVSFIRFGRAPATHAYLAKLWGTFLFIAFVGLLGFGSGGLIAATIVIGCLADAEVIAILLVSREPPVDVPTLRRALDRRRRGMWSA
jgi:CDP-diacylglycerol--glycerol-3-phosphate 3-phosphatidyltransferase